MLLLALTTASRRRLPAVSSAGVGSWGGKFSAFPSQEAHVSVVSCGWMLQCLKHLDLWDVTRLDVCRLHSILSAPWAFDTVDHTRCCGYIIRHTSNKAQQFPLRLLSTRTSVKSTWQVRNLSTWTLEVLFLFLITYPPFCSQQKKIHFIPRLLRNHNKKRPTCSYLWIFEVVYWWHSHIQKTLLSNISKILEVNYRILQGRSNSKLNKGPVDEGVPRFRRSFLNGVSYNRNKWVYLALFHPENSLDLFFAPTYNWCLWARKVHIQEKNWIVTVSRILGVKSRTDGNPMSLDDLVIRSRWFG